MADKQKLGLSHSLVLFLVLVIYHLCVKPDMCHVFLAITWDGAISHEGEGLTPIINLVCPGASVGLLGSIPMAELQKYSGG